MTGTAGSLQLGLITSISLDFHRTILNGSHISTGTQQLIALVCQP